MAETASSYAELMRQVKELEKQAAPFKAAITEFAKKADVVSLDLGEVTIEKRITEKGAFDKEKVSPDWLWRMQKDGFYHIVGIGLDNKKVAYPNSLIIQTLSIISCNVRI